VGIVDVPGHENFIKTMVAGATGMDGVILVVAADDGVMPQTREHLEILTLLGIRHGIVALTKIDRVAADEIELVRDDLCDFLRGTFLQDAPILPLSNVTGDGYDAFLETLWALVQSIRPRRVDGVFRVPIERGFSAPGYGTVVAGIPVAGSAKNGDAVVLLPQGAAGRIRRIEVYGHPCDAVLAGQCAAINVGQWDHHAVHRGNVIAAPGYFQPQEWFVCTLRTLPRERILLKSGTQVKFHTGTSEVPATIHPLESETIAGGAESLVQFRTAVPVVAGPGDHFIVRSVSPVLTIGGGTIVEGVDRRFKRCRPEILADLSARAQAVADAGDFVEYCLRTAAGLAAAGPDLAVRAKVPRERIDAMLRELVQRGAAIPLGGALLIHRDTAAIASAALLDAVARFHLQSPDSPGIAPDQLRQLSGMSKDVFEGLLAIVQRDGRLRMVSDRLALPSHRPVFRDEEARLLEAIESIFRKQLFHPPSVEELAAAVGSPGATVEKLLKTLREHKRLVAIEEMLFHVDAVERARQLLVDYLAKEGRLESVQFKYILDTTRKFALPLLDYFDRAGATRRVGNTRYPKSPPADPPRK
jgi:selenocysteine-specific elongation factor